MKYIFIILTICFCIISCENGCDFNQGTNDSTAMVNTLLEKGKVLVETNSDSSLVILLDAVDYSKGCKDADTKYELYKTISQIYEKKNLSEQQQSYQLMMAEIAHNTNDIFKEADAYQRMSTTSMVQGSFDKAIAEAKKAFNLSPKDSLEFKAQTAILLSQIYLQKAETDSMRHYLDKALEIYPKIANTELYVLSKVYALYTEGKTSKIDEIVSEYQSNTNIHLKAELTRLKMDIDEEKEDWKDAFSDASKLLVLTDSISSEEASASMARIHELQHEQQMEKSKSERLAERTRLYLIIISILSLLLVITLCALFYRKKAIKAHEKELEAMRLADEAQMNESVAKEENIQLHKLYYEHLYAIILPILNARRGKTGHIDLEESSWKLIESNTDMVLPGFTTKLKKSHPSLSLEDLRFCCMLMMRVPNAILADVYGIAASSVAIKKQRMKKKLDTDIHEQTIEDYLNKYVL